MSRNKTSPRKNSLLNAAQAKPSALHLIYARQQPKVHFNQRQANLLKTFAEEDYRRIAQLIVNWLNQP